jgi:hypothetical protein
LTRAANSPFNPGLRGKMLATAPDISNKLVQKYHKGLDVTALSSSCLRGKGIFFS